MTQPETTIAATTVAADRVVTIRYTMFSPEGDVIDRTPEDKPVPYLHGRGHIVPGVESRLDGAPSGARLQVVVPPKEAFGERIHPGPQLVPRSAFPDDLCLEVGDKYGAQGADGAQSEFWITGIDEDLVIIDANHPWAGVSLRFDVEVVAVREATEEEIARGCVLS